jgi:hypothetical protein
MWSWPEPFKPLKLLKPFEPLKPLKLLKPFERLKRLKQLLEEIFA